MAARTFTSAGTDNLWSNPANWDGGTTIPADGDSVTIPSGQTCEYDYNSAYTTGIAGITITGTLSLTRTAGTYKLFMKAATTINGAGTFDCGTSVSPIPFAAKHVITGGVGWKFDGSSGLSFSIFDAEPTIKYVKTTVNEANGATVLHVDTDVTGDIWTDGDLVRIVPVKYSIFGSDKPQERTIAAGGITSNTITITSGITGTTFDAGSLVVLITRNVRIIGTATNVPLLGGFLAAKIVIGGGAIYGNSMEYNIRSSGVVVTGGIWLQGFFSMFGSSMDMSNYIICGANGFYTASNIKITDSLFAGVTTVFSGCWGSYVDNCKFYCTTSISISHGSISNSTVEGASNFLNASYGAIVVNCTCTKSYEVIYRSQATIYNSSFNSGISLSYSQGKLINCLLSGTENVAYGYASVMNYTESIDHDQVAGAYKAWTKGGVTTLQTTNNPTGFTSNMSTVLENAANEGYWQKEVLVGAGASVTISMALRKSASMTYLPRIIIFDKATTDPFAGGIVLNTFTMTDSTDTWEYSTYVYTNTGTADVTLVIRSQGMNATGTMLSAVKVDVINVDLTSALAKLDAIKAKTDILKNPTLLVGGEIIV